MPTIDLTLQAIGASITNSASYTDLFGSVEGRTVGEVKTMYRRLLRNVHPDRYADPTDKEFASGLFARVEDLYQQAITALNDGSYGKAQTFATVTTRRMTHVIKRPVPGGDICDGYLAESARDSLATRTFCKIARDPRDSDLMKAEAAALKKLHADGTETKWYPYVSELVDSFVYADGMQRRDANVLTVLDGFYTLKDVRERCGGSVKLLDAIWMWRRLLMALGFAHENGVVHGAVLPDHVMIWPEEHGVVLIDWCYSRIRSDTGYDPIVAIVDEYAGWYPPEVLARQAPSPATDLAMAARLMIWLLGGSPEKATFPDSVPKPFRAFLKGCLLSSQTMRPQNAWLLLREFDDFLEQLGRPFHPRTFRIFTLPAGSGK